MASTTWGGIFQSDSSGSYSYAIKAPALSGSYTCGDEPFVWMPPKTIGIWN